MISYELAKQLKEAGFPQSHTDYQYVIAPGGEVDIMGFGYCGSFIVTNKTPRIDIPTLSELIEACGYPFRLFCYYPTNHWGATNTIPNVPESDGYLVEGDTPEEAVAKLWLRLNEKK